jgi:hypothetical protein
MQLRIAALADYTNITQNGKLNILGIFSQIYTSAVPAIHPQMQLVLQFVFEPMEAGEKNIRITLLDADGKLVLSLDGTINIPRPEGPDPLILNQVMQLQNILLPHFGSYEFVVEVDGQIMPVKVPVDVVLATPSGQNRV